MAFFIVETNEQLQELIDKDYDKVFIEPIYFNNNTHPSLNKLSLLYIKPLNGDKGYMLCINHSESLSLNKTDISNLLTSYKEIYLRNRKSFLYFFPLKNTFDISFKSINYIEPTTPSQEFFYQKFYDKENINTIIPLVKHYEKCENIFSIISKYCETWENKFQNKLINVFYYIERSGIKIDKNILDKFYELNNDKFSIYNNIIHTQYNLYTTTGRPSNSFNGINFAALDKNNGCREAFIPKNDCFIEIDISAYHPTLAASLINYNFGEETPYQYFAREAGVDVNEAKILMFKQIYGGIYKEYKNIEYFKLIQDYIDKIWLEFKNNGYYECPISGYKFSNELENLTSPKLFNYILQNLETSNNILIIWDIIKVLKGKSTQIVLYTYDSILIDYNEEDNVLDEIKQIFNKYKLKIKTTQGKNYGNMLPV